MEDFIATNWWVTSSGTDTWSTDYTRHRSGVSDTYTSTEDLYGRGKTGRELDTWALNHTEPI